MFFFPSSTPPNSQMNHVGFCTAVACVTERFSPHCPTDEIQMDNRRIALYSPAPNYWMVLETDAVFDVTISKPLLQKAYAAFTLRYGVEAFLTAQSGAVADFFEAFALFLQNSVMNNGPDSANDASSPGPAAGGSGASTGRRMSAGRAVAESLLNCPVSLLAASTFAFGLINSVVAQYLSLITTQVSVSSNAVNIHALGSSPEVATGPGASLASGGLCHRAAWAASQYMLVHADELKVMASTMGQRNSSLLLFLLMLEPRLSSFVAFVDDRPRFCFITRSENVVLFLIVEDAVQQHLHTAVEIMSMQLARDVSELLRTGSCSILRENPTSQAVVKATLLRTNPSKRLAHHQIAASASYQVLCYNRGVVHGPPLHLLPRAVYWQLAAAVREAMIDVADVRPLVPAEDEGGLTSSTSQQLDDGDEWLQDPSDASADATTRRHRMVELWQPLQAGAGWLYSCQRNGRIVAVAFDPTRSLSDCFEIAAKVAQNMFHGTHMFALEGRGGNPRSGPN